jgi:hypothetical protein
MLALLPLAASVAGSSASPTVLDVYRQACFDGELQITPDRGELVDITRMPDIILHSDVRAERRQITYVRMKQPGHTFVMIEQFDPSPRVKFKTICKVASTQWTAKGAQTAFIAGTINPKIWDTRDPGHIFNPYVIDQPTNGLRKRLFVHDDWVMIETAVYAEPKQPRSNKGTQ